MVSPFRQRFASPAFPASHPVPAIERATLTGGGLMAVTKAERNRRQPEQRVVKAMAYANRSTTCCNCGRRLHECGPKGDGRNANGSPCTWDAGHPDGRWLTGELRPECSHCNRRRGAADGNRKREPHTPW